MKAILNIEKYHGKIFSEKKILYHIKAPRILRRFVMDGFLPEAEIHE